jgi:type I restriction enzyme M protein
MVKDNNGVEQEVADGLKGRIIPFELVQKMRFQDELAFIIALQSSIESIDCELETLHDELLAMDDTEKYFDVEKDNAFITNEITADSKPKAVVDEEIKVILKSIVSLLSNKKAKKAEIKSAKLELEKKTIETIQSLDVNEINQFLELKWIVPITSAINELPNVIIQILIDKITSLNEKYAVSYNDIEQGIEDSEKNLAELIEQLTGDEFAIKGLFNLIKR